MNVSSHMASHGASVQSRANPSDHQDSKPAFGVRIADIAALQEDGSTIIGQRKIPTLHQFDQAFGAFAQGTLMQTENSFAAVEDLQPGERLMTADGKSEVITWIGSAMFSPSDLGERMRLTRIMADSFGVNRPTNFISLGSAARVLQTPPDLRGTMGTKPIMTPAPQFVDGVSVIEVAPPTPMRLFHIGLRRHAALYAGGLEVESFHPGPHALHLLSHTLRSVFMSCFPHINQLGDFGPMAYQRAPEPGGQTAA